LADAAGDHARDAAADGGAAIVRSGAAVGIELAAHAVGVDGDDVDGGQEGVGAVESRQRATGDLDALDHLDGDELGADERVRVGAKADVGAVDHDLHDPGTGAQTTAGAAHRDVGGDVVVDDVQAWHGLPELC